MIKSKKNDNGISFGKCSFAWSGQGPNLSLRQWILGLYGGVDFQYALAFDVARYSQLRGPTANTTFTTKFNEKRDRKLFLYIGAIGNFPINDMFYSIGKNRIQRNARNFRAGFNWW